MYHLHSLRALTPAFVLALVAAAPLAATPARSEALLLVEASSGKVLHAENAAHPWYPASLSKLMTAYVTLRAVKEGRITFDTQFTVSRNAVAQAPTKMGFPVGTKVTVDNALKMMLVRSANDMAVLLAEGVDGSIDDFAQDMTATAHRLGMSESNFVNPNGLPADGQITSARDLAILARAIIRDFPEYGFYFDIPAIKYGRRVVRNYNPLLGRYPDTDGMKTGFICASGFNLVATATRNGRRLIAVVLGAPSSKARGIAAAELLESGFMQNPLSWLAPSRGTVDSLAPINASPPNLHDEVCGRHRKRISVKEAEEEAAQDIAGGGDSRSPVSGVLSSLHASIPKGAALLSEPGPVVPVVVYTGPMRTPAQIARLASLRPVRPAAHHKKSAAPHAAAAKRPRHKASEVKAASKKAVDGKTRTEKKTRARAWTPTSPAALAASPPPELRTTSRAKVRKKRHSDVHSAKSQSAPVQ